jgi:hypothetical protein
MKSQEHKNASSLFLVRLWQPESGDAQPEWNGRVVHITSGKASNFLDLPTLAPLLLEMLARMQENREPFGNAVTEDTTKGE